MNTFIELLPRRESLIYLDESGYKISMRRKGGWAPVGEKAISTVANVQTKNYSCAAAMTVNGMFHYSCIDVPFDSNRFEEFIVSVTAKLGRSSH